MSKLLKLKFLLGGMLVAFVFAVSAASALAYTHSVTLKQGSSGAQVVALQQALKVSPADGKFGAMTKAAVVAYQAANGLTADGVVGAATGAKLAGSVVAPVTGNYPAGCSSAEGYSTTTGTKCDSVVSSYPAGCSSAVGYSTTTGVKCDSVSSYPAGCSSAVGYSSTTGAKCDGAVVSTPAGLSGGAGNISSLTKLSTYNDEVLNESVAGKVLAFEVKADNGSDLNLTSLKLKFLHASTGSYHLDRYIGDVSVYLGSTKVGSLSSADFTKDTADNSYSGNIALSGVKVLAGGKVTLAVEVKPNATIDSTDQNSGGLNWTVSTVSVRYTDATGAILTDSTVVSELIGFTSVVNSGDLKLKLTEGASNPVAQVVTASESGTTMVPMLSFNLKAEGGAMDITKLQFLAVSVGDSDGTVEMVSDWELFKGADSIATYSASASTADDATNVNGSVIFSDISGLTLAKDTTTTFTVKAKIKQIATGTAAAVFDQSDSLTLSLESATFASVTLTLAETADSGDTVATGDRSGAVTGNTQTFYSTGVVAKFVSANATKTTSPDTATVTDSGAYVLNFDITAVGADMFIDKSSVAESVAGTADTTAGQGIEYYVSKGGTAANNAANKHAAPSSILTADGATTGDSATDFKVLQDQTRHFHLTVTFGLTTIGGSGQDYYRVNLGSINWAAANATANKFYTVNLSDYQTSDLYLSDY